MTDPKDVFFSVAAQLPYGAYCANCQNVDKLVLMPLYNENQQPAIALVFLCGVCELAVLEGSLRVVSMLKLQFVGI